jgi:hypothetical protein
MVPAVCLNLGEVPYGTYCIISQRLSHVCILSPDRDIFVAGGMGMKLVYLPRDRVQRISRIGTDNVLLNDTNKYDMHGVVNA